MHCKHELFHHEVAACNEVGWTRRTRPNPDLPRSDQIPNLATTDDLAMIAHHFHLFIPPLHALNTFPIRLQPGSWFLSLQEDLQHL